MLLNVGFWNTILEPNFDIAGRIRWTACPKAERDAIFRALRAGIGPRHLRNACIGAWIWAAPAKWMRASVDCPLLFLAGGEDRINPPGTVERVAALYKGPRPVRDHAGHEPLADRRTGLGKSLRPRAGLA